MFWNERKEWDDAIKRAQQHRDRLAGLRIIQEIKDREHEKKMDLVRKKRELAKLDAIFFKHGWMYDWRGWLIKVVSGTIFRVEYRDDHVVIRAKKAEYYKIILKAKKEEILVVGDHIEIAGRRLG